MSDDKQDDSVQQALRQGLCGRRVLPEDAPSLEEDAPPLEERQAMEIAAYLDGGMDDAATQAFEDSLLRDGAMLELVIASRAALVFAGVPGTLSSGVVARARGLRSAPRREGTLAGLRDWMSGWFSRPWQPAMGGVAFGLYALFCVQVFDMGQEEGEGFTAAAATGFELEFAGGGFTLALDDIL
jgi:anti-sigma factor RsiW